MCGVSCLHLSFTVSNLQTLNSALTSDFFNKDIQVYISSTSEEQTFLNSQQRNYDNLNKVQITSFALLKFNCKLKFSDQFKQIHSFVTGTKGLKCNKANFVVIDFRGLWIGVANSTISPSGPSMSCQHACSIHLHSSEDANLALLSFTSRWRWDRKAFIFRCHVGTRCTFRFTQIFRRGSGVLCQTHWSFLRCNGNLSE